MIGLIRIIGGKWRGRKLPVLDSNGLRPTTDRVKETLFNWLMPVIQDANCLDCFSGSGSLGFESISRGAYKSTLVEKNVTIAKQLKKNCQLLNAQNIEIINHDLISWLNKPASQQFDLVFIDPPFHQNLTEATISLLENNGWLKNGSYIYIETETLYNQLAQQIPSNWYLHREKIAGQVHSRLFIRADS